MYPGIFTQQGGRASEAETHLSWTGKNYIMSKIPSILRDAAGLTLPSICVFSRAEVDLDFAALGHMFGTLAAVKTCLE